MITSASYNLQVTTRVELDRAIEELQRNHPNLQPTSISYRQRSEYQGNRTIYHNDFLGSVTFAPIRTNDEPNGTGVAVADDFLD